MQAYITNQREKKKTARIVKKATTTTITTTTTKNVNARQELEYEMAESGPLRQDAIFFFFSLRSDNYETLAARACGGQTSR